MVVIVTNKHGQSVQLSGNYRHLITLPSIKRLAQCWFNTDPQATMLHQP